MVSLLLAAGADPTQLDVRYSSHRLISYCPDEMHVTSDFGEVKSCFAIHCYNRQCRSLFLSSLNAALILSSLSGADLLTSWRRLKKSETPSGEPE